MIISLHAMQSNRPDKEGYLMQYGLQIQIANFEQTADSTEPDIEIVFVPCGLAIATLEEAVRF